MENLQNCIPVGEGVVVKVDFLPSQLRKVEVVRRYGRKTRQNPLLEGRFPVVNIYAQERAFVARMRRGSIWVGDLYSLTVLALSRLPFPIEREINPERLRRLFDHQRPGLIGNTDSGCYYEVKSDQFQRWVRRYYTSLIFTAKEAAAIETAVNKKWEDEYWRGIARDRIMGEEELYFQKHPRGSWGYDAEELPQDVDPDMGDQIREGFAPLY